MWLLNGTTYEKNCRMGLLSIRNRLDCEKKASLQEWGVWSKLWKRFCASDQAIQAEQVIMTQVIIIKMNSFLLWKVKNRDMLMDKHWFHADFRAWRFNHEDDTPNIPFFSTADRLRPADLLSSLLWEDESLSALTPLFSSSLAEASLSFDSMRRTTFKRV